MKTVGLYRADLGGSPSSATSSPCDPRQGLSGAFASSSAKQGTQSPQHQSHMR